MTKLQPSPPIISCVNSPEFLSSDLSELPFTISTSTLCLCFEIGHLDEGRCNFLKVEAKSYPLWVGISVSDLLVSILYLPVMHLTPLNRNETGERLSGWPCSDNLKQHSSSWKQCTRLGYIREWRRGIKHNVKQNTIHMTWGGHGKQKRVGGQSDRTRHGCTLLLIAAKHMTSKP